MNSENIYWLFSSAAQSIAAFVAFLLAGYTLVHAMMDSLQQRDDTLEEIHSALIRQYYRQITALAVLTGAAVLGSLAMLYLNGFEWPLKNVAVTVAALLDSAAIGWGIAFVVQIIDPDKYSNAAKQLIQEDVQTSAPAGVEEASEDFFTLFTRLETAMRMALEQLGGRELLDFRGRPDTSFRSMLRLLYQHQLIDRSLFNSLMHLGRYRNLAYYGRVGSVDKAIVDQTQAALTRIQALVPPERRASS